MKHHFKWCYKGRLEYGFRTVITHYELTCAGKTRVQDLDHKPYTQHFKVTCPKCLDILIATKERELEVLRTNRKGERHDGSRLGSGQDAGAIEPGGREVLNEDQPKQP